MQQGLFLGLTAVIVTTSVIIEIEKDPPTLDWVRQYLWGKESSCKDKVGAGDNFNKALNG